MSKLIKIFAVLILLGGTIAITQGPAAAQHRGGVYRGGHSSGFHGAYRGGYRGGGHYRGGGWGPGFGFGLGLGLGYPYGYGGPYYYAEPNCGYVRVRVWRSGHWVLRRAWRCW
jgi:hypothetical protein